MSSSSSSSSILKYDCLDCQETFEINKFNKQTRCHICNSLLIEHKQPDTIPPPQQPLHPNNLFGNASIESLNDFFDILDPEIRESLEQSIANRAPSRPIDKKALDSLGILKIDSNKMVLYDSTIAIGTFRMMCVLADFSPVPSSSSTMSNIQGKLIVGDPIYGESDLNNQSDCEGNVLLLERGKVSFARKSYLAQQNKAKFLIVCQSETMKWPFQMTDSIHELTTFENPLTIPICMISYQDSLVLHSYLKSISKSASKSTSTKLSSSVTSTNNGISLEISPPVCECSVCRDDFDIGQEIYKLPCRHVYHQQCLSQWLLHHNTCPMCRQDLV